MAGGGVNPDLTVVTRNGSGHADFRYFLSEGYGAPHHRVVSTLAYLEHLRAELERGGWPLRSEEQIVFQLEDNPVDVTSVTWEAMDGWRNVRLIPDLYYYMAGGYEDFEPALEPWAARRPSPIDCPDASACTSAALTWPRWSIQAN